MYFKMFSCLVLSLILHFGLILAPGVIDAKRSKEDVLVIEKVRPVIWATIEIPTLSRPPVAANPPSKDLASVKQQQPKSKTPPTETDSASSIALHYFKAEYLTRQPKLKGNVDFDNPDPATMASSGTIQLRLLINTEGTVDKIISNRSSLPETFVDSVTRSFYTVSFEPGEIDGLTVRSQFFVEIRYEAMASSQ